jgi:hypothetical protein
MPSYTPSASPSPSQSQSDRRLNQNIQAAGASPSGIPIYTWRYCPGMTENDPDITYTGAMAQDLLTLAPHAVLIGPDGYYQVSYAVIDVEFKEV